MLLDTLLRASPGVAAEQLVATLDCSASAERAALLAALDGRMVVPGPAGAPTRGRADVLPTGRNLFTIDPRAVPNRSSWFRFSNRNAPASAPCGGWFSMGWRFLTLSFRSMKVGGLSGTAIPTRAAMRRWRGRFGRDWEGREPRMVLPRPRHGLNCGRMDDEKR